MAKKPAGSGQSTPARTGASTPSTSSAGIPQSTSKPTVNATPSKASQQSRVTSSQSSSSSSPQEILQQLWNSYVDKTPQRTKLIDVFMAFLIFVGVVQFVYCVLLGNYPFNAFLSGFGMTVGQFVLTASLRIQTNPENASEFKTVSPERAFADFVFGSLVLHFFCVNFIN